jgi:hypothetical protein
VLTCNNRVQVAAAEQQLRRIEKDMARLNNLIAKNEEQGELLQNDTANLERNVLAELKDLEVQTDGVKQTIERCSKDKKSVLEDILDTEQNIMNWERKLQLENEMQDVLNPAVGQVSHLSVCAVRCCRRRVNLRLSRWHSFSLDDCVHGIFALTARICVLTVHDVLTLSTIPMTFWSGL